MRYIDADALKVKCEEAAKYANSHFEKRRGDNRATKADEICTMFKHGIDAAPTADIAPVVHGEWGLLDECSNAGVYCSVCHKAVFRESAWYKNVHIKSKYCPNCGAKMGGGT